jgi:hypothetical protein
LLLDYDRVFSAMGVPACLWRRTGEIYKGNREFSELVGVDGYMLRDVKAFFEPWHLNTEHFSGPSLHLWAYGWRICCQLLGGTMNWPMQQRNTKLKQSIPCYFQKYGHVAFDSSQKAVLTSCVLRYKPLLNSGS